MLFNCSAFLLISVVIMSSKRWRHSCSVPITVVASVARHVISQLGGFLRVRWGFFHGCLKAIAQQRSYSLDYDTSTRQHNTPWLTIPRGYPFIKPTVLSLCCLWKYTNLIFHKSNHFNQVVDLTRSHEVHYTVMSSSWLQIQKPFN